MDNENIIDPWLYPGCVCEVWDEGEDNNKKLAYFVKISGTGHKVFNVYSREYPYNYYKPIGTPWDYAPSNATHIEIDAKGKCLFINFDLNTVFRFKTLQWNNCPDHLKGKTLKRPEWSKDK